MAEQDHRLISIAPRIRYNTIGGVNGPLVILENVRYCNELPEYMETERGYRSNSRDSMRLCL